VEKLLTVTDKSALGPGAGRGQFLGEAESNIRFEHMFDSALTHKGLGLMLRLIHICHLSVALFMLKKTIKQETNE
jgi:hypothetical protein